MLRLILSHIPDDFNPGTDIAAGAWCFMCRPKDFVYWGRLNFLDDPGESGLDRREILQQCVDFGERLLPEIARRLNAVNETQYSIHFWRRMTDWWLISLLQIMFLAQHKSLALKIAYGHLPLSVELLPYNIPWDFASTRDFNNRAVKRVEFFSWMLSRFIEASPGDAWCTRYRQDWGKRGRYHAAPGPLPPADQPPPPLARFPQRVGDLPRVLPERKAARGLLRGGTWLSCGWIRSGSGRCWEPRV